jgi:hypothetical protein
MPRMLVKRTASPEPGPSNSPAKRTQIRSPQSSNISSVEPNILPEDQETRLLYLGHWNTIQLEKTVETVSRIDISFTLNDITSSTFPEMVRHIFTQQTSAFRINVSFGFILRNVETRELRYYHPSQSNARLFRCSSSNQERKRFRQISGRIEPSRHIGIYQKTAS